LDAIVSAYMENDLSPAEMVARGFRTEDVRRVVEMIHRSEYKRRQAPIGIRITTAVSARLALSDHIALTASPYE